ncbi:MAG: hypothetical protein ACI3T9_04550 [Romboutsia timonensis]
MIKEGNVIICKDGVRLLVVKLANTEEYMLVDLDKHTARFIDIPTMYISQYHRGIATIIDSINEL